MAAYNGRNAFSTAGRCAMTANMFGNFSASRGKLIECLLYLRRSLFLRQRIHNSHLLSPLFTFQGSVSLDGQSSRPERNREWHADDPVLLNLFSLRVSLRSVSPCPSRSRKVSDRRDRSPRAVDRPWRLPYDNSTRSRTRNACWTLCVRLSPSLGRESALPLVGPSAQLERELGLGSLERVELLLRLEKAFRHSLE